MHVRDTLLRKTDRQARSFRRKAHRWSQRSYDYVEPYPSPVGDSRHDRHQRSQTPDAYDERERTYANSRRTSRSRSPLDHHTRYRASRERSYTPPRNYESKLREAEDASYRQSQEERDKKAWRQKLFDMMGQDDIERGHTDLGSAWDFEDAEGGSCSNAYANDTYGMGPEYLSDEDYASYIDEGIRHRQRQKAPGFSRYFADQTQSKQQEKDQEKRELDQQRLDLQRQKRQEAEARASLQRRLSVEHSWQSALSTQDNEGILIAFSEFPWPSRRSIKVAGDLESKDILDYLRSLLVGCSTSDERSCLRAWIKFLHPDRFTIKHLERFAPDDREQVRKVINLIAGSLSEMMA